MPEQIYKDINRVEHSFHNGTKSGTTTLKWHTCLSRVVETKEVDRASVIRVSLLDLTKKQQAFSSRKEDQMKFRRAIGIGIITTLVLTFCFISLSLAGPVVLTQPGVYSRYNTPDYDGWKRISVYVPVRDGTKLAVDIYRPTKAGVMEQAPLPVIFQFTGYRRATYTSLTNKTIHYPDTTFTKYGYVMVYADTRGKGASYGTRMEMCDRTEAMDGHDLVQWIGSQPWSDGNVGMWGASYTGNTQVETASNTPKYLKTVIPEWTDYAKYDATYRGGMHRTTAGGGETQDDSITVPVDEDTVDANNNGITDMLEAAIAQHVAPYLPTSYLYLNFIARMPYRDSYDSDVGKLGEYWINAANYPYFKAEKEAGIAFYQVGGWYDLFGRDTLIGYNNLKKHGKMFLAPFGHFGGTTPGIVLNQEFLRWFDYWLKGIDDEIMSEPPVYYYTVNAPTGTEWRFSPQFPLGEEKYVKYYLASGPSGSNPVSVLDGGLSTVAPTAKNGGQDSYKQNYNPVCTAMMGNCSYDQWSLTYTTDVLSKDLQVTGSPIVHLWAASTATDQDFFADLEDIDANGKVVKVVATQGRLRASHRSLAKAPFDNLGLPWHREYQQDMVPLTPNAPTELVFDILPTSYIFPAGHRMRVVVMAASKQALNYLTPDSTVTIYHDKKHASYVSLPIIDKLNVFQGTVTMHTRQDQYSGPADLYASPEGIYLSYAGKWLKWKTERAWDGDWRGYFLRDAECFKGDTEHFMGEGKSGHISVVVSSNPKGPFNAIAEGWGIDFKGTFKY